MRLIHLAFLLLLPYIFLGCVGMKIEDFTNKTPELSLKTILVGNLLHMV